MWGTVAVSDGANTLECFLCNNLVMLVITGFEVSGIVDEICPSVSDCSLAVGDHVVVYPTNDEELTETGSVNS